MNPSIYLDNAATTAPDPAVLEVMREHLQESYANPASVHAPGRRAAAVVEQAREQVGALMGAPTQDIIWTSGATEANNLAIKGVADFYHQAQRRCGHMISVATEHKAVLDPLKIMQARGWRITRLGVNAGGRIDLAELEQALADDTALISVMHVNNEIGVIQDVAAIARIACAKDISFHVDAAQSFGKLAVNVDDFQADLVSVSAHKLHGPKGVGALYVRRKPRARILAQLHGGGQEQGLRAGTLATHDIAGFGMACEVVAASGEVEQRRIAVLRDRLWQTLSVLPGVTRNGDPAHCVAGILNISVDGVDGEALLAAVTGGDQPLAVATGSACSAARAESSYVLRALGRSPAQAAASLRLSLGRFNSDHDVEVASGKLIHEINRLRSLSPLWSEAEHSPVELARAGIA